MIPHVVQQFPEDAHCVAVAFKRVDGQHNQVLDAQQYIGIGAGRRTHADLINKLGQRVGPQILQVTARYHVARSVLHVILHHKEANDGTNVGLVCLQVIMHVGRRLEHQFGLIPTLLAVVFLEVLALPQHHVDVQAAVDGREVDEVLGTYVSTIIIATSASSARSTSVHLLHVLGDDGVDVSLLELLGVRDGQLTDARRELPDVLQELPEIQG